MKESSSVGGLQKLTSIIWFHGLSIRLFQIHTKMAIMTLLPTLYSHIVAVLFIITARNEVGARLYFHRHVWFCSQGGLPQCMLGHPPRSTPLPLLPGADIPTVADTPWEQTAPPRSRHLPGADTPLPRCKACWGDMVNA